MNSTYPDRKARRMNPTNQQGARAWTAGPWRIDNNASERWSVDFDGASSSWVSISGDRKEPVAFAVEPSAYGSAVDANARLIAAAPELLEALNGLVALCESLDAYWDADEVPEVIAARAALSKALPHKGEGK